MQVSADEGRMYGLAPYPGGMTAGFRGALYSCIVPIYGHMTMYYAHTWSYDHVLYPGGMPTGQY